MKNILAIVAALFFAEPALAQPISQIGAQPGIYTPFLATGSSTPRPVMTRAADAINAKDYGVKCDGVTDDTSAINALMSSLASGKEVYFPAGTCIFTSTLTWRVNTAYIHGAGIGGTTFRYTGAATNIDLLYLNGSSSIFDSVVQNINVASATIMTAGAAIHAYQPNYIWLKNVQGIKYSGTNTLWNGLWIDQPNFTVVDGFNFQAQNDAIAESALGIGTGNQYDTFLSNGKLWSSAVGLHIGGGIDNIHTDNVEDTSNTVNVLDDNAITAFKNQELYFGTNFVTDQGGQYNYVINDAYADQANYCIVSIAGPVTAAKGNGGGGDNIDVRSAPNCDIVVSSPYVVSAARDGIRIEDASAKVAISPASIFYGNAELDVNPIVPYSNLLSIGANAGTGVGATSANLTSQGQVISAAQGSAGPGNVVVYAANNSSNSSGANSVLYGAFKGTSFKAGVKMDVANNGGMTFYVNAGNPELALNYVNAAPATLSPVSSGGAQLGTSAFPFANTYTQALNVSGVATLANGAALGTPASVNLANASALPLTALPSQTANTVLGALTATTPSGLAVPSCSATSNALQWTSGSGFGCNSSINAATLGGATFANAGPVGATTLNASGNDAINANTNAGGQSIASSTPTVVTTWTTKSDRVAANWNASTGVYTTPTTGQYVVSFTITYAASTSAIGDTFEAFVRGPSGATYCQSMIYSENTSSIKHSVSGSCIVSSAAAQGISVVAYQTTSGAVSLSTAANDNSISIYRLP